MQEAAKKVVLSTEDAQIWLDHLQTVLENRKRGAAKAAATRRARYSIHTLVMPFVCMFCFPALSVFDERDEVG